MIKINGKGLKVTTFPNNERAIHLDETFKSLTVDNKVEVSLIYESDIDILDLQLVKRHLDSLNIKEVILHLDYIPYSRMDRTEGKYVFALKYIADIINSLKFTKVISYDVHSDVSLALFDRLESRSLIEMKYKDVMKKIEEETGKTPVIIIPDLGASKRYKEIISNNRCIVMDKVRDFATGEIKSIKPLNIEVLKDLGVEGNFVALILDDLCCKGGTFVGIYEALKVYKCEKAYLFVSHAENTINKGEVFRVFEKVFTSTSMVHEKHDKMEYVS